MSDPTKSAVAAVWREQAPRLIGALVRIVRDVSLAEELAQDALVAALEEWPRSGIPDKPGAWLMTTAKNRAINAVRRAKISARVGESLGHGMDTELSLADIESALEASMDQDVRDDVLRLVFAACHPVLPKEARVALTLRMIGGLTTEEIARAYLSTEPTMAQRIVRAKRTIGEAQVPLEIPRGEDLGPRLASVLEVVYLIFNEGYSATAGEDLLRPALAEEAVRLGRLLAELAPDIAEVHGLVALMELQAARAEARVDAAGEPVLLADQDRDKWDEGAIARGLESLERADALSDEPGAYHLQAAIAACHARSPSIDETEWSKIASLYRELGRLTPSPVIELNRAMAVSRANGPAAGLALLDELSSAPTLARYHLLPSARADLLEKLGRFEEARDEFERAAELAGNVRQRDRLKARAAAVMARLRS